MKRILGLFTICLAILDLSAQSWQKLYQSTDDCWGSDWQACSEVLEKAVRAARTEFGEEDSIYALTVNDLGVCYSVLGQYEKSETLLLEALSLRGKIFDNRHPAYGECLINLGSLYESMGKYEKALPFIQEAIVVTEHTLGKQHAEYGVRVNNLGNLYTNMEQFELALPLLEEALAITGESQGKESADYGKILQNLGRLHVNLGAFKEGLLLYQQAMEVTAHSQGKQHPQYGERLTQLGNLYAELGQNDLALPLLQEAIRNVELTYGKQHPEYGKSLNNLALVVYNLGQTEQALSLQQEALSNAEQTLGKNHPYYGTRLSNLAVSYKNMGKYDLALPLLEEALANTAQTLGKQNSFYGIKLRALGHYYRELGQHETALPYFQEALTNVEISQGKQHPEYEIALLNLGNIYLQLGQVDTAAILMQQLFQALSVQLSTQFDGLNDRLQNSFLQKKRSRFHFLSSFLYDYPEYEELYGLGFDQQLLIKGFLQHQRADLFQSLRHQYGTEIQQEYEEWESLHRILARQYQKPISKRLNTFDSLRNRADELETTLANHSLAFRKARKHVTWKDVQNVLAEDEAAIEFTHFPYFHKGKRTDSILYLAFVLRPHDIRPQMISLFEEKELTQLLSSANRQTSLDQLYTYRGIKPREAPSEYQNLTETLWRPIDSLLTGVRTIYVAPSGLLNRINIGAIPLGKKSWVSDKYHLIQMGSTKNLVFSTEIEKMSNTEALLFGGIHYDRDSSPAQAISKPLELAQSSDLEDFIISSRGNTSQWSYLDGTAKEVDEIGQLLQKKGYQVQSKSGGEATEESLRFLQNSPRILHIATHGYFFPDPRDTIQMSAMDQSNIPPIQLSDHPMVRSGLILAGANHAWAGNPVAEGEEDGILTAYEISRMDLSNTELVVLSACETGLGDIQGNEGVYGLQRAFKIAGAKYVMMSLWQVPDKATQELMTAFYENWLGGMEIRSALQAAQKQMRKKYKEPYYWAGFVLVE